MTFECTSILIRCINCVSGLGYYIYTESTSPRIEGETGSLISATFPGTVDVCVSFFYNMYGADMGTVNMTIEVSTLCKLCF